MYKTQMSTHNQKLTLAECADSEISANQGPSTAKLKGGDAIAP